MGVETCRADGLSFMTAAASFKALLVNIFLIFLLSCVQNVSTELLYTGFGLPKEEKNLTHFSGVCDGGTKNIALVPEKNIFEGIFDYDFQ